MKTLIYVPIIHTAADLGSVAKDVTERGRSDLGKEFWKQHELTVDGFWTSISKYFDSYDVSNIKIYQDGMIAQDEMGMKIVDAGVISGSKNYEIVRKLIKKGGTLIRTEDIQLVKDERNNILKIIKATTWLKKLFNIIKYSLTKNILLEKRDRFITKRIEETLFTGETGVVFIGAYHNIKNKLSRDIQVNEIKDIEKVRKYQQLLPFSSKNRNEFELLKKYLIEEIN